MEWTYVAPDRDEWQTFANTVMNHTDPSKAVSVLSVSGDGQFFKYHPFIFGQFKVLKCGAGEGWRRSVGSIM